MSQRSKTTFANKRQRSTHGSSSEYSAWPREEGTRFELPNSNLPEQSQDRWSQKHADHYNKLLDFSIEPTRFMHKQTLQSLKLGSAVDLAINFTEIFDIAETPEYLYPDLVRQCLASASLTYTNPHRPKFEEATFSFFAGGRKFSLSLLEFCEVYGFSVSRTALSLPKFTIASPFWDVIAAGSFKANTASQSSVRHPALRIAAKVLSNILYAKEDTAKMRTDELQFLYYGIRGCLRDSMALRFPSANVNMGAIFASVIVGKKMRTATRGLHKTERIGSLLTPLFRHFDIDLSSTTCVKTIEHIDVVYLINCEILRDETTYRFRDREGNTLYCKLPNVSITTFQTPANIGFRPAAQHLCPDPCPSAYRTPKLRRGSSSRASQHLLEDEEMPDFQTPPPHTAQYDEGEFTLPHLTADADQNQKLQWIVDSQRKNNKLMHRILALVSRGCFTPQPSTQQRSETTPVPRDDEANRQHTPTTSDSD